MGAPLRVVTDWVGDPAPRGLVRGPLHQAGRRCPTTAPAPSSSFTGTVTAVDGRRQLTVTLEAICGGEKVLGAARVVLAVGGADQ